MIERGAPVPGALRGQQRAWALYDFANSSFTTIVVTFVYPVWFMRAMAADEISGTAQWSLAVSASAVAVALLAPAVGAAADRRATRARWLRGLTLGAVAGTLALPFVEPPRALLALVLFAATNTLYELALAVYNAFLPGLAEPGRVGRLSAAGWAIGYVGGLLCLVGSLALIRSGWIPEDGGWPYRAAVLLAGAWFALFAVVSLAPLREPAPPDPEAGFDAAHLRRVARRLAGYRDLVRLLVARLVYNDGLVAIFAFGGLYAAGTFGFSLEEILLFGIVLNVCAGLGAWAFGRVDDHLGGRATVLVTLVALTVATVWAAAARAPWELWAAGSLIGLLVGPAQSASRSLAARFSPAPVAAEVFGLFAVSGKLTSFAGPLVVGQVTALVGSQRAGVASIAGFFVLGALLLLLVDETRGLGLAEAEERRLAVATGRVA